MNFIETSIADLELKPFYILDKEWALLSAGRPGSFNTMTVSWGFLGTVWGQPSAVALVRPQRYTRAFIEREEYYTLSFFDGGYKKDLGLLGAISGRDGDKIAQTELSAVFDSTTGAPFFEQANLVLVCKKLYAQDIKPEQFIATELVPEFYPQEDFHRFYIGQVTTALRRRN